MSILRKPLVTEKMTAQAEATVKHYGFIVDIDATKLQIKHAVETLYEVKVEAIRTLITNGKRKSRHTKRGMVEGKRANQKKAFVTLQKDQVIDFYKNI